MANSVHTLDLEQNDGTMRQYGAHFGTIRADAIKYAEERALWHVRNGAPSAALKQGGKVVRIWDFRDIA